MTEESKLLKKVKKYLKDKRVWCFRVQAQSNLFGLPDIMCLYQGVLIGLELKTDIGTATDLQSIKLETINKNGGLGIIVRSLDEVKRLFDFIEDTPCKITGDECYEFYKIWCKNGGSYEQD